MLKIHHKEYHSAKLYHCIINRGFQMGLSFEKTELKNADFWQLFKIIGRSNGKFNLDGDIIYLGDLGENPSDKEVPFEGFLLKIEKDRCKLKLAFQNKPHKTSRMVSFNNGFAGLNGGFWDEKKMPLDWFIFQGKTLTPLENLTRPCLLYDASANGASKWFILSPKLARERIEILREDPTKEKQIYLLQAGPFLVNESKIDLDYSDYKEKAYQFDSDITKDRHPRSIFGLDDKFYYLMAINGRSRKSAGLFLEECAFLAKRLGMRNAMNLDGGASSTLIVDGKMWNQARFSFFKNSRIFSMRLPWKERKIPNCLVLSEKDE